MAITPAKTQCPVDELADWISAFHEADTHAKRWREVADRAKEHITAALGEAEVGTVAGKPAVRYTIVNGSRVNLDKMRDEHPDLVDTYTVPQVTRRFTLTGQV